VGVGSLMTYIIPTMAVGFNVFKCLLRFLSLTGLDVQVFHH
jgi:hypothetical protein